MRKIKNYEKNESLATGFVKPKITSLFFDKIWIPKSLISSSREYFDIPKAVLVTEKDELLVDLRAIRAGDYYFHAILRNRPVSSGRFYEEMKAMNNGISMDLDDDFNHIIDDTPPFKYSRNRNKAIFISAENFCRQYNLHISPVFYDLTEFEKETQLIKLQDLLKHDALKYTIRKPNALINKNALTISIQDFPSIIEEKLSWEQVLDIRKDNKNRERLKRFTQWSSARFKNMSPDEIRETLELELEEYKKALKEHGIKALAGTFSTMISSANALCSIFENAQKSLLPLLAIASVSFTFSVNTYFSNMKNKNNPIAYLYDITKE